MKLRWTPLASSHLESAYEYVSTADVDAAAALIERILSAVEVLRDHPNMGRKGRVRETKELVISGTPYVVAYRVREDQIEILAVLHGSRRWPDRLT